MKAPKTGLECRHRMGDGSCLKYRRGSGADNVICPATRPACSGAEPKDPPEGQGTQEALL